MARPSAAVLLVWATTIGWAFFLRPVFLGGPASYIIVSGVSMEPTMYTGDLAVLLSQDGYELGDIVAFKAPGGNVIHRIVGGSAEAGFTMRGDNKNSVDPWKPKPDEILGKLWVHVPGAGRALAYLRQPLPLAATVAGLALLSLLGGQKARRRWRGGRRMAHASMSETGGGLPGPAWAVTLLGIFALLGAGLAAVGVLAFRQPLESTEQADLATYQHTAVFDYTVKMHPSTLYPDGIAGPVRPSRDKAAATAHPPIYTRLAEGVELGFSYSLDGARSPDVSSEIGATLKISAGENGWSRSEEILPAQLFSGCTATARIYVDFASIWSLIETIEEETGTNPGTYVVSIVPRVEVTGRIDGERIEDTYEAPFVMQLSRTQITIDRELARSEPGRIAQSVTRMQRMGWAGVSLPVAAARLSSAGGAAVCLAIAGLLAAYVFLGWGRDSAGKARARYGSMLIGVSRADLEERTRRVEVASMDDLARLAKRNGQTIFHKDDPGSHLYFVDHGEVVYTFRLPKSSGEG